MKIPFLKPRLIGARFEQHSMPLDVLRDWTVFEDFVVEVARALYFHDHPGRKRLPRGFVSGFALHLSGIEEGSAMPVIERVAVDRLIPHSPDLFDRARDTILDVIDAASSDRPLPPGFPPELTRYFDQFGRSLGRDEWIEFPVTGRPEGVRYDRRTRKRLVLTRATGYLAPIDLRGTISEADVAKSTYTLTLLDGARIPGTFSPEFRSTVVTGLGEKESPKVAVRGTALHDRDDRPKKIEETTHIEILDPNDLAARLEEFEMLTDGWLDGGGTAPPVEGLRWLAEAWTRSYPEDLPNPFAYPTPEGGVQLEWTQGNWEIAVEIDLRARQGEVQGVRVGSVESVEINLDLGVDENWQILEDTIRARVGS